MPSKKKKKSPQRRPEPAVQRTGVQHSGERRGEPQNARRMPVQNKPPQKRPPQNRPPQNKPPQNKLPQNRPPQSAEQRKKTDRAYSQAVVHRNVKGRKRGSRGRNFIMYYILGAVVIITVLVILSNTVLFSCSSIEVEGNTRYTAEQIIAQSGLEKGQNLLHIDAKAAEKRVFAAFPYIDKAEVVKSFPTKMRIVVQEAEKWFLVSDSGVTAAVSRLGRIVELGSSGGLPVVEGFDPADLTPGAALSSEDDGKTPIPAQILEAAEECGISGIKRIDMTDRFDIVIECDDDITLEIGGVSDITGKFTAAVRAIQKEHSGVVLDLRQPDKIFVRDDVKEQQELPELGGTAEATGEAGTAEPPVQ